MFKCVHALNFHRSAWSSPLNFHQSAWSSPANPAFTIPDPLSHTSADTSPSSAIFLSFLRIPSASSSRVVSPRSRVLVADLVPSRRVASRPRPRRDSRRPLARVSRASRGSFVHPDASRPIDRSRIVRESNRSRIESFANRINQSTTRFEIVRAPVARSRPSFASRPRARRRNFRDVARASVASVGRLASPRAHRRPSSAAISRSSRTQSIATPRRRGRARRGPAGCCTIYKIRNNRVYVRSKTTHIFVLYRDRARRRARARSRGAGRATGVAHLYIKYETITYTLDPKPPIYRSINRTHPSDARRAISRLYKIRINRVYITPQNTDISIKISVRYDRDRAAPDASPTVSAASALFTRRATRARREIAPRWRRAAFERTRSRARVVYIHAPTPQRAPRAHNARIVSPSTRKSVVGLSDNVTRIARERDVG